MWFFLLFWPLRTLCLEELFLLVKSTCNLRPRSYLLATDVFVQKIFTGCWTSWFRFGTLWQKTQINTNGLSETEFYFTLIWKKPGRGQLNACKVATQWKDTIFFSPVPYWMASMPPTLVTSWFNMVAGAPAIMPTFWTAGQRKGEKEAIGIYKLSFNGGPQELPHILILHLTGQKLVTWLNLTASAPEKCRM